MAAGILTLDLHGRNIHQAKTAINAQLRRAKAGTYRLRLIHGYHNGTALQEMILDVYSCHPQVLRLDRTTGPGVTDLVLREF